MNRLSMFFVLLSMSIPAVAEEPIRNEILGLTVTPKMVGKMTGLSVESVLVGKPGDHTGLMKGDLLLGWIKDEVSSNDGGQYSPMTPELFKFLPPKIVRANTEYRIRVFRPSGGRVANLPVYSAGSKYAPAWPREILGMTGMSLVVNGESQGLRVVSTYPHGLADEIGLQKDDEILMAQLIGTKTFSAPIIIESMDRLMDFLMLADKQPDDSKVIVRFVIKRGDEWVFKQFTTEQIHAPKI